MLRGADEHEIFAAVRNHNGTARHLLWRASDYQRRVSTKDAYEGQIR